MVCFLCGEGPKFFFISRELWRLEISAVEEQRPFWELPWRLRADLHYFLAQSHHRLTNNSCLP